MSKYSKQDEFIALITRARALLNEGKANGALLTVYYSPEEFGNHDEVHREYGANLDAYGTFIVGSVIGELLVDGDKTAELIKHGIIAAKEILEDKNAA